MARVKSAVAGEGIPAEEEYIGKIHNNSKYLIHVHKKMYKSELALSVF
jgi:hypothetical protein